MADNDQSRIHKRSLSDLNGSDDPLLPEPKKRKLNEITKEDTDFLLQFKAQQSVSLHTTYSHNPNNFFPAESTASSTNDVIAIDALSNKATTHSIAPHDKIAEKYYRQIVQRSSRIGDEYQAITLPTPSKSADNEKYGGSPIKNECPTIIAEKLRKERNAKRNCLDDDDDDCHNETMHGLMNLTDINFDEDEDEDDDEDFNLNEYDVGQSKNESLRIMEGIMGRRSDWLYGDDGVPNDQNTKLQYLVKWKDSKQPIWEFADNLEAYRHKIDLFEDDEMEDVLCDAVIMNQNDGTAADLAAKTAV